MFDMLRVYLIDIFLGSELKRSRRSARVAFPKDDVRDLLSAHLLDTVIRKSGGGQSRAGDRKMGMRSGGLKPRGDLGRGGSCAQLRLRARRRQGAARHVLGLDTRQRPSTKTGFE